MLAILVQIWTLQLATYEFFLTQNLRMERTLKKTMADRFPRYFFTALYAVSAKSATLTKVIGAIPLTRTLHSHHH